MILTGARWAVNETLSRRCDVAIVEGTLRRPAGQSDRELIDLSGLLLLPGLINAHDHLEFNLFPKLGHRTYSNCVDWAADIYRPGHSPVKEHIAVPMPVRLWWGGIRNLLGGVTTVAHHNPYDADVFDSCFPVRVARNYGWAHSLAFTGDVFRRFRETPPDRPFILHAAEGNDTEARSEIHTLEQLGVLASNTVLVHANAVGPKEIEVLQRHRTSIVWCPRSNLATYGQTLSAEARSTDVLIALGTDSAISSSGDLIDEIHTAVVDCDCPITSAYRMVTSDAAQVLRLNRGEGFLWEGGVADIVAVSDEGQSPAEALLKMRPEFVMIDGRFRMISGSMAAKRLCTFARGLQSIELESRGRYLIDADLNSLHRVASASAGAKLRLAGRSISVGAAA